MARFWQYLIALAAILATVVILTVKDPYAGGEAGENSPEFSADPSSGPIPPPPIAPLAEETAETPRKPVSSWFELERGDGLSLVLSGTLRDGHVKSRLVESARGKVPELVEVVDRIEVNPAATAIPGLDLLPGLIEALISGTRDPFLRVEPESASIGGTGGDGQLLDAIRGAFDSNFRDLKDREDRLRLDPEQLAPEIRMPLVLYLGPLEGKYACEGSLPTWAQRKAVVEAAVSAIGGEKFADHLQVSPGTVDEAWMSSIPSLVGALLDKKHDEMELIVVDRSLTLKGVVADLEARNALIELARPAREAGYEVVDALRVKK
ncbi:MAG: hypothetical protein KDN18_03310 [Verrucomicrobiae bacterium]|nr:hypothetical protein [Verrucomicrobiae bacterium]